MKKLLVLGFAIALVSAAFAYPTLTGPTGLANVPTAAVQTAGQFSLAADWYNVDPDAVFPIRALYGVGENLEVGATFVTGGDSDTWGVNAKYLTPLTLGGFNWALGAQYLDNNDLDATATQVYFVGTRAFTEGDETMPAINGTLGINWTNIDAAGSEDAFRFFAGLDATFSNKLTAALEFQSKDSDIETDSLTSIVVRYPFTPSLTGQVGFSNTGLLTGTDDHNIFVGLSYNFGAAE